MNKRVLSLMLTLILLLSSFAGCGTESGTSDTGSAERPAQTGSTTQTDSNNVSGEPGSENTTSGENHSLYPTSDYSGFEMPEATERLTVYAYSFISSFLTPAVERFKEEYPGIQVDYQILGDDEYQTRLRAEIPAGKGPDVLIGDDVLLPDIYKTMSTGILSDLGGFMAKDEEFDSKDYYEGVIKGGRMFGKQFLLPLACNVKCFVTTIELLEKNGLDLNTMSSWEGFYEACQVFHKKNPGSALFAHNATQWYYLPTLYTGMGFRMIDYERGEVSFDEEQFRQMVDLCRLYCNPDMPPEFKFGEEYTAVHNGECFFASGQTKVFNILYAVCDSMRYYYEETPVIMTIPDGEGGSTAGIEYYGAIPEASNNKLNAWRFLKILLSDELQYGERIGDEQFKTYYPTGIPVRKESFRHQLNDIVELYEMSMEDADMLFDVTEHISDAVMLPSVIRGYVSQYMNSYITSKDGSNYDKVFAKLKSTLDLYKDE